MEADDMKYLTYNQTSNQAEATKFDYDLIEDLDYHEDYAIFNQHDLPNGGFQIMEEIRRRGKLCDVTLKVF